MLNDLISFGEYLDKKGLDDFGLLLDDEDHILQFDISIEDNHLIFEDFDSKINSIDNIEDIGTYENFKLDNPKGFSLFSNDLFVETNQNFMIPSNTYLACLTPFVFSSKKMSKNKIGGCMKQEDQNGEFIKHLEIVDTYLKNEIKDFYQFYAEKDKIKPDYNLLYSTLDSINDFKELIKEYFHFLYDNYNALSKIQNLTNTRTSDIYLYFKLPDEYLLINDILYFYCKYLKIKSDVVNLDNKSCSFCSYPQVTDIKFSALKLSKNYNWDYEDALINSKVNICPNCSLYVYLGIQKLIHVFEKHFILIPKLKNNNYENFNSIITEINTYYNLEQGRQSKFSLLNNFLYENNYNQNFNFDFVIFEKTRMGEDIKFIKKYVENYKAFLADFKRNNWILFDGKKCKYLFDEKTGSTNSEYPINTIFDIERLLISFFRVVDDGKITKSNINHFYQIYSVNIETILKKHDSITQNIFVKNMHNIFSFIYELNFNAFSKDMLNEIVLNFLIRIQKFITKENLKKFEKEIRRSLNYYYFINTEILGVNMLENIDQVKKIILDDEYLDKKDEFDNLIKYDPAIKYYLIGQFIRKLDNKKLAAGKNTDIFSIFVNNVNRNNISELFTNEILIKNNFYIKRMVSSGKVVFDIFELENVLNDLFDEPEESNLSFEDYILLMFTGYYTENIFKSNQDESENEDEEFD